MRFKISLPREGFDLYNPDRTLFQIYQLDPEGKRRFVQCLLQFFLLNLPRYLQITNVYPDIHDTQFQSYYVYAKSTLHYGDDIFLTEQFRSAYTSFCAANPHCKIKISAIENTEISSIFMTSFSDTQIIYKVSPLLIFYLTQNPRLVLKIIRGEVNNMRISYNSFGQPDFIVDYKLVDGFNLNHPLQLFAFSIHSIAELKEPISTNPRPKNVTIINERDQFTIKFISPTGDWYIKSYDKPTISKRFIDAGIQITSENNQRRNGLATAGLYASNIITHNHEAPNGSRPSHKKN